ncbi:MAG: hypothetical protein ACR2LV_00770 [Solirubrobacteraceae bacterium]
MAGTFTLEVIATGADSQTGRAQVTYQVDQGPTRLTATPVLRGGLTASLTRSDTGAPLAGQTVVFSSGGRQLCRATTNPAGSATCRGWVGFLVAVLHGGYKVTFAGTQNYLPASAAPGSPKDRLRRIERVTGAVLVGLGVRLVLERRRVLVSAPIGLSRSAPGARLCL